MTILVTPKALLIIIWHIHKWSLSDWISIHDTWLTSGCLMTILIAFEIVTIKCIIIDRMRWIKPLLLILTCCISSLISSLFLWPTWLMVFMSFSLISSLLVIWSFVLNFLIFCHSFWWFNFMLLVSCSCNIRSLLFCSFEGWWCSLLLWPPCLLVLMGCISTSIMEWCCPFLMRPFIL